MQPACQMILGHSLQVPLANIDLGSDEMLLPSGDSKVLGRRRPAVRGAVFGVGLVCLPGNFRRSRTQRLQVVESSRPAITRSLP
jgi:hypothetical protein